MVRAYACIFIGTAAVLSAERLGHRIKREPGAVYRARAFLFPPKLALSVGWDPRPLKRRLRGQNPLVRKHSDSLPLSDSIRAFPLRAWEKALGSSFGCSPIPIRVSDPRNSGHRSQRKPGFEYKALTRLLREKTIRCQSLGSLN